MDVQSNLRMSVIWKLIRSLSLLADSVQVSCGPKTEQFPVCFTKERCLLDTDLLFRTKVLVSLGGIGAREAIELSVSRLSLLIKSLSLARTEYNILRRLTMRLGSTGMSRLTTAWHSRRIRMRSLCTRWPSVLRPE